MRDLGNRDVLLFVPYVLKTLFLWLGFDFLGCCVNLSDKQAHPNFGTVQEIEIEDLPHDPTDAYQLCFAQALPSLL